ncbi:MAG: hypothetical protein HQ572_06470 [Candidatus Omnitrophica bacterium]|nr:hypothetical protein [Candidatus Omnitrophota bacterium]
MKKYIYILIVFLVLAVALAIANSEFILKRVTYDYVGNLLHADISIDRAAINIRKSTLKETGIRITADRGLDCNIETAFISYGNILELVKNRSFTFRLEDVRLSYPGSEILNSVANALSIELQDVLKFDYIAGEFMRGQDEIVIKSLEASGRLLRLFADATIEDGKNLNCSFKMLLSQEMISTIPDSIRKVFFKQDGDWSEVTLYLSGSIDKPSINFSTDLFKLTVR